MENEKYTLRKLRTDDIFSALRIISKIGVKEVRKCFAAADVQAAISGDEANAASVGIAVGFEIAALLAEHLPDCKNEIYAFLASISGMSEKEIADLDMAAFAEMVMDVIRKDEFRDFFTAVAKSLKPEK